MILRIEDKDLDEIIKIRHKLHENPEISGEEYQTTNLLKNFVKSFPDVEIIDFSLKTGLVFKIKTGKSGKIIGLRSDIDAILQSEENNLSYKSKNMGVMHACGHDFHMASLLGAFKILQKNKEKLKADVVFVFQNSEETTKGAKELIDKGLFDKEKIQMFFGFHNWPMINSGKVILKKGALMATKANFIIEIIGKGGHGSNPHLNIDPIVSASNIVMSLQSIISRNMDPQTSTILSINSINGGSSDNLVVDRVKMTATIRSLDQKSFQRAIQRMEAMVRDISQAYECKYKIEYTDKIPLVYNSDSMYQLAKKVATRVVGKENIENTEPTMASEDFSFYMQKVPSFMYRFGSGEDGIEKNPLHARNFFASDKGIKTAAETLANSVIVGQNL
ncbi:MAG: M20 family metallopeptidase [Peptoniphilaceae bacterium]|nr:M20 family metallopeptidase [Peptoniphilaceae bacterium]MDY6018723.1 M20 family metallopeptidase [Anaerococcus sp.]